MVDAQRGTTKNFTPEQLLMYRNQWFEEVEKAKRIAALGAVQVNSENAELKPVIVKYVRGEL